MTLGEKCSSIHDYLFCRTFPDSNTAASKFRFIQVLQEHVSKHTALTPDGSQLISVI